MSRNNSESGFTIVELMLAMGFVSALLLAIAMTVIQIGNIYNHGVTLKSVDQSGSAISREIQRSITSSMPFSVDVDSNGEGSNYIKKDWGGRLCTGQYSYVWNYGDVASSDHDSSLYTNRNVYTSDGTSSKEINFVKVYDSGSNYCKRDAVNNTYPSVDPSATVELLNSDSTELAIHSFTVDPSASDSATGQRLYSISFSIGTNDQNALTTDGSGNKTCRIPSDSDSDPFFCSVVGFDITARAGNVSSNDNQN